MTEATASCRRPSRDTHTADDLLAVGCSRRHRSVPSLVGLRIEALVLKERAEARLCHVLAVVAAKNGVILLDLNGSDTVSFSQA